MPDEGDVLVQGDELADCERGQGHAEDGGGRTVAGEHAGRDDPPVPSARTSSAVLPNAVAFGLRRSVREQLVHVLVAVLVGFGVLTNAMKSAGMSWCPVDLVEGALPAARLAPEDLAGLGGDGVRPNARTCR